MSEATTNIPASVGELLRHAGAFSAAEQGQVHVISVAAIREVVGERWQRHEPLVEDFVIRSFRRGARDDDFIVRVNEADFILIQPSRTSMAALSRASQLMRETLSYFLGAAKNEHINIAVVDSLRDCDVVATRVSHDDLQRASDERSVDLARSDDGSPPWERFGVSRPPRKVVTIRRPDGGDIQAVFYLDPVWNVARGAVVSFVARTVAVQTGSDGEFEGIDPTAMTPSSHAALAIQRIRFLKELVTGGPDEENPAIAVHLPISFNCLSHSSPRTALLSELKKMSAEGWQTRSFVEITDVPAALPHVRLTEIVTQLRPFLRGVFVRAPSGPVDLRNWARCGAIGMVATVEHGVPEREQIVRIEKFARQCEDIGVVAAVYGVKTRSLAVAAWSTGVTLLSGDLFGEKFGDDIVARRFPHSALYVSDGVV